MYMSLEIALPVSVWTIANSDNVQQMPKAYLPRYGRLQGFLFRDLRFAPLAILQNLVASVVLHLFPVSTLIARTQARNTKSGLSIKFAYFNARGLHTHPSSYLLPGMHFNRNMRQPCNAV
jgi:hypothetical protein